MKKNEELKVGDWVFFHSAGGRGIIGKFFKLDKKIQYIWLSEVIWSSIVDWRKYFYPKDKPFNINEPWLYEYYIKIDCEGVPTGEDINRFALLFGA